MADSHGLDGISAKELAETRRGWWDDAFTEALVRRVPAGARNLLDVGCGLCTAAHALLPNLPTLSYVGLDADPQRLAEAAKLLVGTPFRERVELREGSAQSLPLAAGEFDVALTSMTLQHLADPGAAVREIARVLAAAGTFIGIEPDNTANQIYFDGVLEDVNGAIQDLFKAQRRHRRPADNAIGPALAQLAEQGGLQVVEFLPYAVGKAKKTTGREFFAGMSRLVDILARQLPADAPEVEVSRASLARRAAAVAPTTTGYGCQIVPVFICVARKR